MDNALYWSRYAKIAIWLFVFSLPIPLLAVDRLLSSHEINLTAHQKEELAQDLPAQASCLDSNNTAWILGQHFLWKWRLAEKHFQQIKLATELPLKSLLLNGDHLFVSDDEHLFVIEITPFRVFKFTPLMNRIHVRLHSMLRVRHYIGLKRMESSVLL